MLCILIRIDSSILMNTLNTPLSYRRSKYHHLLPNHGAMINSQWLELPISRTIFHGPKDVRAIEVLCISIIATAMLCLVSLFCHRSVFRYLGKAFLLKPHLYFLFYSLFCIFITQEPTIYLTKIIAVWIRTSSFKQHTWSSDFLECYRVFAKPFATIRN